MAEEEKKIKEISAAALTIHRDKLYAGYCAKKKELTEKLVALRARGDWAAANQTYSELRALKDSETFATNGVYLHEWYFAVLGGDGVPGGEIVSALAAKYGSVENFLQYFSACGMAARGWVILGYDFQDKELKVFTGDAHHQGGVWGVWPLLVLDVYEHAYFLDYGAERKNYLDYFLSTINWSVVERRYQAARAGGR